MADKSYILSEQIEFFSTFGVLLSMFCILVLPSRVIYFEWLKVGVLLHFQAGYKREVRYAYMYLRVCIKVYTIMVHGFTAMGLGFRR